MRLRIINAKGRSISECSLNDQLWVSSGDGFYNNVTITVIAAAYSEQPLYITVLSDTNTPLINKTNLEFNHNRPVEKGSNIVITRGMLQLEIAGEF